MDLTTIDANGTSRIGIVEDEAEARFTGVTITGGNADVGDNDVPGQGGAFRVQPLGMLRLTETHLVDNVASINGGAVSNVGNLLFVESTASGNRSRAARRRRGGIYSLSVNDGSSHIENSTVSGNTAGTRGGGVYVGDESQLDARDDHRQLGGRRRRVCMSSTVRAAGLHGTLVAGNAGPECGVEGHLDRGSQPGRRHDLRVRRAGDLQGVDARLAPLGNYGGPTQDPRAVHRQPGARRRRRRPLPRRGPARDRPARRTVRHRRLRGQHRAAGAAAAGRRHHAAAA